MPITHFQILSLPNPDFIESTYNGNPLVINQQIPVENQNLLSFKRTLLFENNAVIARFKWKALDVPNNRESNPAFCVLSWNNSEIELLSANVENTILNNDNYNLFETLPLSASVERIQILSITGAGNLKFQNQEVYEGQIISITDLYYTVFTSLASGGGTPYFELNYAIGNKENINLIKNYFLTTNILSLAELSLLSENVIINSKEFIVEEIPTIYNTKTHNAILKILNGQVNKTAQIEIVIDCPFLGLNDFSEITVSYNGEELILSSNQTLNLNIDLDNLGQSLFQITKYIVNDIETTINEGTIDVNLISIDSNVNLVDLPQTYEIGIYTPPEP